MSNSEEILEQDNKQDAILRAVAELSKKIDDCKKETDDKLEAINNQFESVRRGIVDNSVRFDRFDAQMLLMRSDIANLKADVKELTEEIRHNRKVLV